MGFFAPCANLQPIYEHLLQIGKLKPIEGMITAPPPATPKTDNGWKEPAPKNEKQAPAQQNLLEQIGFMFHKHGQMLAAAIVFAELVKVDKNNVAGWCGLGTTLAKSAGQLVRKPFLVGATKAFSHALL